MPEFGVLCREAQECVLCPRMRQSISVLGRASGPLSASVMFIGEAPGRLGADATGIPFHGDATGFNFESLLEFADISRGDVFITNAVLCNPKDEHGNNATPTADEIGNCIGFLRRQIDLVNPAIVATLGGVALKSLGLIEEHGLALKTAVRTVHKWNGRMLLPMYHPGPRAMIHRSFANQRSDYQFLAEQLQRRGAAPLKITGKSGRKSAELVQAILRLRDGVSYFAVHKIAYLVELAYFRKTGKRLTDAYFIRQKDGPYCTNLQIRRITNSLPVRVLKQGGDLVLFQGGGFPSGVPLWENRSSSDDGAVADALEKYVRMTDNELKRAAYLSTPMRKILRLEQKGQNFHNTPITFE